ncbi:MAG: hypothetical protein F6J93_08535 [Oscillatoria sp. SIO1A7]|nr:hypothetical protein [Oscillatoria sp. SIO1A7]
MYAQARAAREEDWENWLAIAIISGGSKNCIWQGIPHKIADPTTSN